MIKILFVNNNLQIGGIQMALVNLLNELICNEDFEITLLLFSKRGVLLDRLPKEVHLITPSLFFRSWGLVRGDKAPFREKVMRLFFAGLTRLFGRSFALRIPCFFQRTLSDYDVAVSYLHSGRNDMFYGGCSEFVLHCVEAKKKIVFLHCDYEKIEADSPENTALYAGFDKIAACSGGCRDAFLRVLPQFADKTTIAHNCQDYTHLFIEANRSAVKSENDKPHIPLRLITVARLGKEKGVLRAIRAISGIDNQRHLLHYEIVGDGIEMAEAQSLTASLHLEEIVFFCGEKLEPYEKIANSDVLLIPSLSEAAPLVIGEAAALGVPVLTTETSSAREMVEESGYGWICENTEEGIRKGIIWLLEHPDDVKNRAAFLRKLKLDNSSAVKEFMALLD